jgi:hypothetical protein
LRGRRFISYARETREEGKEGKSHGSHRSSGSRRASREEKHATETEDSSIGKKKQVPVAAAPEEGPEQSRPQVTAANEKHGSRLPARRHRRRDEIAGRGHDWADAGERLGAIVAPLNVSASVPPVGRARGREMLRARVGDVTPNKAAAPLIVTLAAPFKPVPAGTEEPLAKLAIPLIYGRGSETRGAGGRGRPPRTSGSAPQERTLRGIISQILTRAAQRSREAEPTYRDGQGVVRLPNSASTSEVPAGTLKRAPRGDLRGRRRPRAPMPRTFEG